MIQMKGVYSLYIEDIFVYPLNLPMLQNFSISGGQVGNLNVGAPHVYVQVITSDGVQGWGEARPSHRWSYETIESVVTTIQNYFVPELKGLSILDMKSIHQVMDRQIASGLTRGQPIAKSSVDMAVLDAAARSLDQPLGHMFLAKTKEEISLSYLISVDNVDDAKEKAQIAKQGGYKGVDVKIGINPSKDLEILKAIKEVVPNLFFRVDANQAYELKEAMQLSQAMESIGIDVFEQPLSANDLKGHAQLRQNTTIPIALDESIWTPKDLLRAIQMDACDIVVIKLTKMGGLYPSMQCGMIAKAAGKKLLGGGLTESTLALLASAHLFNILDIETPVDLNGPMFLSDDPSKEMAQIINGDVRVPQTSGIGWDVDEKKLAKYTVDVSFLSN